MASNLPIAGYGRSLPTGGSGGSGLPTGSSSEIQNPSYEISGTNLGEANNWTVSVTSSAEEFAVFDHPGSNIITDQIPAEQPTLGYSVSVQLDGTIIISQAADADSAQEDFEQSWSGNENYEFVFSDAANDHVNFSGKTIDDFESGWGNDSGLLIDIDAIDHEIATFNSQQVEHFDAGWPATFNGIFLNVIPNVVFGTWDDGAHVFTPGDAITSVGQYADTLYVRALVDISQAGLFQIHFTDKNDMPIDVVVFIDNPIPAGTILNLTFTSGFGVRSVTGITVGPGNPGLYSMEGDPGQLRDTHNNLLAHWERATFG